MIDVWNSLPLEMVSVSWSVYKETGICRFFHTCWTSTDCFVNSDWVCVLYFSFVLAVLQTYSTHTCSDLGVLLDLCHLSRFRFAIKIYLISTVLQLRYYIVQLMPLIFHLLTGVLVSRVPQRQ